MRCHGKIIELLFTIPLCLAAKAEEQHSVNTAIQNTTLSGYIDTSSIWRAPTGLPGEAQLASKELYFALQISERLEFSNPREVTARFNQAHGGSPLAPVEAPHGLGGLT